MRQQYMKQNIDDYFRDVKRSYIFRCVDCIEENADNQKKKFVLKEDQCAVTA